MIFSTEKFVNNNFTTSGSALLLFREPQIHDLTIDGKGMIIVERTIHHGVQGTGNANANKGIMIGKGWIVELEAREVIAAILDADNA